MLVTNWRLLDTVSRVITNLWLMVDCQHIGLITDLKDYNQALEKVQNTKCDDSP